MKRGILSIKTIASIVFSGIGGSIITIMYQHFFNPPQSFTLIYGGNEIIVTETRYVEIVEENQKLKEEIESLKEDISFFQTKIEDQENILATENILKQATDYWNQSDYVQALTILKNSNTQSDGVKALYSQYSDEYTLNLLVQADNMISERRYEDALRILSAGKNIVLNSSTILQKIDEVNNSVPVKLSKTKIASSRFFRSENSGSLLDTVGNSYPSGNTFTVYAEGSRYGYASFYVGEKYTGLTGVIAVSNDSRDVGLEGRVEIYSKKDDDYTLLYQSPSLNRMTVPIVLPELNFSSADLIEIRYYNGGDYFSIIDGYLSLKIIISDVVLYT